MSNDLQIALGVVAFTLAVASPFIISKVLKFRLEIARIAMETEIKKEEIRARNQLEIERMMMGEQAHKSNSRPLGSPEGRFFSDEENSVREKIDRDRIKA